MKKQFSIIIFLVFFSCADDTNISLPASLKVIHTSNSIPALQVDYFDTEIAYSVNPPLSFGSFLKLTVPTGKTRIIDFVYVSDTTSTAFSFEINQSPQEIGSLYILGDSLNPDAIYLNDDLFDFSQSDSDSLLAVRLLNFSSDIVAASINFADSTSIVSNIGIKSTSNFAPLPANSSIGSYSFDFINESSTNVVATSSISILPFFQQPLVGKSLSFVLVGDENSGYQVIRIDNF